MGYLSNEIEGRCEECCGVCGGCVFLPIMFIGATGICCAAVIVMICIAIVFAEPYEILYKLMAVMDNPPTQIGPIINLVVPILQTGLDYGMKGTMCKDKGVHGDVPDDSGQSGSWLMNNALGPKDEWCSGSDETDYG